MRDALVRVDAMGDVRFEHAYEALRHAPDRSRALRALSDEEVIEALAAASRHPDPLLANVLATEAANRIRRLRAALANLGEGVVTLGTDARVQWMNPAAERLLGIARADAMHRRITSLVQHVDARGALVPPEASGILCALRGTTGGGDGEVLRVLADGREVCVAYTCTPIPGDDGAPAGAVLAFQDCGERKRTERALRESRELYKSLFDHSPEGIISVALDGTVLAFNQAAQAITQRPYEEAKGQPLTQFLHPEDAGRAVQLFADVVAGHARETRLRILHKDGHYVEVAASGLPVVLDGEVVGIHGRVRPV